jgi:hypothetical protein
MSFEKCIAEVRRATGADLSEDEIGELFEAVAARFRTKRAKTGSEVPDGDLFKAAAAELNREAAATAAIEKRNAIENLKKRVTRREFYGQAPDPVLGLEAKLVGVNAPFAGSRLSVDAQQRALTKDYLGKLGSDLEKTGTFENFRAGTLDREMARELFELNSAEGKPGISGSKQALAMAEAVHAAFERARTGLNRAGAWIGKYDGYIARTSHDMDKIRRATFEAWRDHVEPRLDERTFEGLGADAGDAAARQRFLQNIYDALASGVHLGEAGYSGFKDPAFKGPGNLAKRLSKGRVLHWKDADAWMDYAEKFGRGNLAENVTAALEHAARHTGLLREFGTNPRAELEADIQHLKETQRQDLALVDKLRSWEKPLANRMDELDGTANMPRSLLAAKIGGTVRAWQSLSSLGGVLLSAIGDVPIKASELNYQGIGFLEAYTDGFTSLARGRGKSAQTRAVMDDLRAGFEGMRGNIAGRFDANDTLPGVLAKAQNVFFKWNGLTYWTDAQRDGAMFLMARHLGRLQETGWPALPERNRGLLEQYGIDETAWELLRGAEWKQADNRRYLTPKAVEGIDDKKIRAALKLKGGKKIDAAKIDVDAWRQELALKLHSYFSDRADIAILNPGARERAMLRQGTQAGTPEGEALRYITQFKAFPVAVISRVWGREIYGGQGGFGQVAGVAHLLAASTLFGYAAMSAKDLAKGREPRDPNEPKTWISAFVQGGGAGIYGDFVAGEYSRFGRSFVETLAGPTASDVGALVDLWNRVKKGDDVAAAAFKFGLDNTPFANLFYTRVALDYLFIYQIQEALNPGFLRRMEKRIQTENNQQFMLRPSDAIPYGGGDRLLEGVR